MQLTMDSAKSKVLRNQMVTIPSSISSKVFGKDVDFESNSLLNNNSENILLELLNKQHPLIHTWLLLSSVSICFLSALFFIAP